jgi:hypothetical protein
MDEYHQHPKPIRFVGDIHGERNTLLTHVKGAEYVVQLGDLDFSYQWLVDADLDPEHFKFVGGNHDNYDVIGQSPYYLGDYGVFTIPDFGDIFYLRGGFSIDHRARRKVPEMIKGQLRPKNLWDEEELPTSKYIEAIKLYEEIKPKILIAHECPLNIVPYVTNPMFLHSWGYDQLVLKTKTNQALQVMVQIHAPRLMLFGHYHRTFRAWVDAVTGESMPEGADKSKYTEFVCVNMLRYVDFQKGYVQ